MGDTQQQENVDVDCGSGREETTNQKEETTTRKTKSYGISIDSSRIRAVPVDEQSYVLRNLGIDVFDQEEFEQGVLQQVDEAIAAKELEALVKSWEKDLKSVNEEIRMTLSEIDQIGRILRGMEASVVTSSYESRRRADGARKQRENKLKQLKKLEASQKSLYHKLGLDEEGKTAEEIIEDAPSQDAQPNILQDRLEIMKELEKEREQLIQTGKMTPFGGFVSASTSNVNEENDLTTDKNFVKDDDDDDIYDDERTPVDQSPKHEVDSDEYIPDEDELRDSWQEKERSRPKLAKLKKKLSTSSLASSKHSEELDRANVVYKEDDAVELKRKKPKKSKDHFKNQSMDDGDEYLYRKRIRQERIQNLLKEQKKSAASDSDEDMPDMEFDSRLKIPGRIWHKLYKYQQTGVKWLWELHCQQAGGVVGDEMGLGKTIEAIAFLAGLKYSKVGIKKSRHVLGPILIVCPVTVLHQWVSEFHKWAPEFRVAVLHETGTFRGHKDTLIRKICHDNGILVTGYSGVRINIDNLLAKNWDYIILDEGHKIRNPDAEITLACKQFRTPHRIILTGSPMQNNLRELWSLFDFVFPGKLGTLPVFMTEFSVPITAGGYANASDIQVQTAYKCACVLRDTINPYLLRRLKKDVKMNLDLPDKNEQVLFCRLTEEQRELYQQYLDSREVQSILAGNYKVFPGLIMLRKICNHPDLTSEAGSLLKAKQDELRTEEGLSDDPLDKDDGYGDWRRAGKMIVVESLLKMWKAQGHRVLLFSQSRQMINILETFVSSRGYTYRRMDGSTTVASRQPLVNKFNKDTSIFVFLLTTRVGGLGINLTGADRVIIYDPDWNPSTDIQARERAWRIGQTKKVTIYRLLISGTIEEKIYHRQIFKQFLTDRVLKDPKQRRFFKTNDLYELFTLDESYNKQGTETSAIFAGTNCEIKVAGKKRRKGDPRETAQPVKKSKTVVKPKFKEVKKFKDVKKPSKVHDDGGAFSIDARDIMEVSQAKKNSKEKPSQQATMTKDEESPNNDKTCKEPEHHGNHGNGNHSNEATSEQTHQVALSKEANDCTKSKDVVPSLMDNSSSAANSTPSTSICDLLKEENNEQKTGMSSKQKVLVDSQSLSSKIEPLSKDGHKKKKLKASSLSDKKLKRLLRSKKKQKRRYRKGKIDGQEISNLEYHEAYHTGTEESCTTDGEAGPHSTASQNEDVVLKTLFKNGGVHSALKHDVIMDSGNPDYTLVESEANRIAQQAVQALKKSRQQCLTARSGVPTWTGASGLSGHSAKPKPKFGKKSSANTTQDSVKVTKQSKEEPALFSGAFMGMQSSQEDSGKVSSSQLLAKMRARNNLLPEETGTSAQVSETEHDALLAEMSQFVTSGGAIRGQATTQEILNRFSTKLPRENTSVFRALLRRVCDFKRDDNRDGVWRLKNDFR